MTVRRRALLKAGLATAAFGGLLSANRLASAQAPMGSLTDLRTQLGGRAAAWRGRRIAIVGAGIAGLTAAYELRRLGLDVVLFEAQHRVGGRVETLRADSVVSENGEQQYCSFTRDRDHYFNAGPARISHNHASVLHYCKELGVALELITNENKAAYFRVGALAHRGPMRLRQFQASMRGNIAEMLAKNMTSNAGGGISSAELPAYLAMLAEFGDLNDDLKFSGSTRGGVATGSDPMGAARPLTPLELKELVKMDFFTQYKLHLGEYLDQQASMMQPTDGMDKIVEAFHGRLADRIELACVVTALERSGQGAVVKFNRRGQARSMAFDRVIVAMPPHLAARAGAAGFSPGVLTALQAQQMSRPAKTAFQAERFWETRDGIYGGMSYTDEDISMLWYPSHRLGAPTGVLVGAYNVGVFPKDRYGDLPARERIRMAVDQGERLHPGYNRMVSKGISRSWVKAPFIEGGWSLTPADEVLRRADGPFVFAGDYVSGMSGWMEGAMGSAHSALRLL